MFVFVVKRTVVFDVWLEGIRDPMVKARLMIRLRKAALGNLGDVRAVGHGVYEMREHFGSGWRMYYVQYGLTLVVMLGGGNKSTQSGDIARAIALAGTLKE